MQTIKMMILWLSLVFACFLPASALTLSAPENCIWEISSIGYDAPAIEVANLESRAETSTSNYDTAPIHRAVTEEMPTEANRSLFGQNAEFKAAEGGIVPDVALGKGVNLQNFSREISAKSYQEWHSSGLVSNPVGESNFGIPFNEATSQTGTIRFNLEGVNIESALSMNEGLASSMNPVLHPGIGGENLITEWELRQVLQNENLFNKTTFHWGGNVQFTPVEAASMGLKFLGP